MISEGNSFIKRVWAALGSRRLFWWICMLISGVIIIGLIFNIGGLYPGISSSLDGEILIRWLTGPGGHSYPVVRAWLMALIVLVFILGINLSVCVLSDMAGLWRLFWEWKKGVPGTRVRVSRKLAVALMHGSYIILLLVHVISATTGFNISGLELRTGQIISHERLPYPLYCEKIIMPEIDSRGGQSRPSLILRPMVADSKPFMIPKPPWGSGWHDGYFYRIYAEYSKPKLGEIVKRPDWKKRRKIIAIKLGINRVHYTYPLAFGGILFMSGCALHIVLRQEFWACVLRWGRKFKLSK